MLSKRLFKVKPICATLYGDGMIYSINGIVAMREPDMVIETSAGIGFCIHASKSVLEKAVVGESLRVVCFFHAESYELYGFLSEEDRAFFELLLSVSGVGPKSALKIMNAAGIPTLIRAIASGDEKTLARQCGVSLKINWSSRCDAIKRRRNSGSLA